MLEKRDYEEIARLMRDTISDTIKSEVTPQLKTLSDGLKETNHRLDETNRRLDALTESHEQTNRRLDETNHRLDALAETEKRDHEESTRSIEELNRRVEDLRREMRIIVESEITPQLKTLAEGHQLLLETLAPKSRVEELEEDVSFLKSVVKLHSDEIARLKKAT